MNLHRLLGSVEDAEFLDPPARAGSRVVGRLIGRSRLAGVLRGSWLGHPVHPLLVTVPIGTWMASAVFDVVFSDVTAARRLLAVGLAATPPTVLAGWADYPLLDRRQQRVGLVHAVSNGVGALMFALAYRAYRRERDRPRGCTPSAGWPRSPSVGPWAVTCPMRRAPACSAGSRCARCSTAALPSTCARRDVSRQTPCGGPRYGNSLSVSVCGPGPIGGHSPLVRNASR